MSVLAEVRDPDRGRAPRERAGAGLPGVQPGGGPVHALELAWGRARRSLLRSLRPRYVARMSALRQGDCPGCPHDVVDPRDLKLVHNACGYTFPEEADRFLWRGRLGIARQGWAEIFVSAALLVPAGLASALAFPPAAVVPALLFLWAVAFFRDPRRAVPGGAGLVVAPADGLVDDVAEVEGFEDLFPGPAWRIGIFLSLFDVHVNRAPHEGRAAWMQYRPGRHRATYRTGETAANEALVTLFETEGGRPLVVRQVAGPAARRIVNELRPGRAVERGERFGLIKFGSRTELYLPRDAGVELRVAPGTRVRAGESVLARLDPAGDSR